MPFRTVGLEQGEFYHFYNRGNNKQRIFFERENYHYFLRTFCSYFTQEIAEMCAYCLMPNHYHLLVRLTSECNYSRRMQYFGIAYVKAMNRRYERCGHLFQGRFKAKLVDSDEYLLHLSRYIHLNPLFPNLVRRAEDWEFSSYRFYLGENESRSLEQYGHVALNTSYILSQFASAAEYRSYVESFAADKMHEMSETLWRDG
jgi:putative transposase